MSESLSFMLLELAWMLDALVLVAWFPPLALPASALMDWIRHV